jgi:hypothetical protein
MTKTIKDTFQKL